MVENYKVITLCGSTKFKDQFMEVQKKLTLEGNIVISVGCFGHAGDIFSDEQKLMLDDMHKRKIDMADEIFVINVGGYIGESTKSEIEYAKKHNKKVNYLDNINNDIKKETLKDILNKIPCEKNCQCCLRDGILSCFKPQKEGYIIGGLVEYITEELMNE
jgi:hypothetical protein